MTDLMLLARKTSLAMIGEPGSRKEALVQEALEQVARRCAEMLRTEGVMLAICPEETKANRITRFARAFAEKIEQEFGLGAVSRERLTDHVWKYSEGSIIGIYIHDYPCP